jgi:pyroglutamyl-peptidase
MPTVLITAFEPYDRWSENASWLALMELTRELPERPQVTTRLYPVDFQKVRERLEQDLAGNYDYALHLGQSPGSASIQLEAIGLNVGGSGSQRPEEFQPLVPEGPVACQSDLPLSDWARRIREAGVPANLSYNAGTYLCNAVLYLSLYLSQTRGLKTRSTFLHLPLALSQTLNDRGNLASMPTAITAGAIREVLAAIGEENDE